MSADKIVIRGISKQAIDVLYEFVSKCRRSWEGAELLPYIGLVSGSKFWTEGEGVVERGEHFIIGAFERYLIKDEIVFDADGIKIVINIPNYKRFFGSYYFDVCEGEIVNLDSGVM